MARARSFPAYLGGGSASATRRIRTGAIVICFTAEHRDSDFGKGILEGQRTHGRPLSPSPSHYLTAESIYDPVSSQSREIVRRQHGRRVLAPMISLTLHTTVYSLR